MKRFIADLHFGHEKVIAFDNRPFETVEQMDAELIKRWNQTVQKSDDIYIVGDLMFRSDKEYSWYLQQLRGRKHLILGNHDYKILKDEKAQSYFESIHHIISLREDGREIILCHYPMLEWRGYFRGSLHIFGHIHEASHEIYRYICQQPNMLNAGASIVDYRPATVKELIHYNIAYKERLRRRIEEKTINQQEVCISREDLTNK